MCRHVVRAGVTLGSIVLWSRVLLFLSGRCLSPSPFYLNSVGVISRVVGLTSSGSPRCLGCLCSTLNWTPVLAELMHHGTGVFLGGPPPVWAHTPPPLHCAWLLVLSAYPPPCRRATAGRSDRLSPWAAPGSLAAWNRTRLGPNMRVLSNRRPQSCTLSARGSAVPLNARPEFSACIYGHSPIYCPLACHPQSRQTQRQIVHALVLGIFRGAA